MQAQVFRGIMMSFLGTAFVPAVTLHNLPEGMAVGAMTYLIVGGFGT